MVDWTESAQLQRHVKERGELNDSIDNLAGFARMPEGTVGGHAESAPTPWPRGELSDITEVSRSEIKRKKRDAHSPEQEQLMRDLIPLEIDWPEYSRPEFSAVDAPKYIWTS